MLNQGFYRSQIHGPSHSQLAEWELKAGAMGRVFNPGFLNSCTLRVSVLLEMGPPEIWDAEQEATTPGFREEVVGDFFFFTDLSFLLCFQLPAHPAAVPCCPWSQQGGRSREQNMGDGGKQGKNEITWGLIRAKVKKLNLFNSR